MNAILNAIDMEIAKLRNVRDLLTGGTAAILQPTLVKKRTVSSAGRARMAAAQKARWAKAKKAS